MIAAVDSYLAVRRAAGFTLSNAEYLLRSFASFATNQDQTHIRTVTAIDWASQAKSLAQLRISEALHLLVSDITPNGLLIRKTKFQKTRLVPLHETAVAGLGRYMAYRQGAHRGGEHVFISDEGEPLLYWKIIQKSMKN